MNVEEIKEAIVKETESSVPNYSTLMKLVQELSALNSNNLRFSVDSGIITRLGEELVGKQETAVCELIKNSYDADATYVNLFFYNSEKHEKKIEIVDNGNGMTRSQLINSFMRLGTADKINSPYSTIFKRKKAGRKGIGRIASQRLGSQLIVRTKADGHPAYELYIDWMQIENAKDLFSISFPIKEIQSSFPIRFIDGKSIESGTTLIIKNLSNEWSVKNIKDIYKYITDLLQPEYIIDDRTGKMIIKNNSMIETEDQEQINNNLKITQDYFLASCFLHEESQFIPIERTNKIVYDFAIAEVDAQIDMKGIASYYIKSNRFDFDEGPTLILKEGVAYKHARSVKLKAFYYIPGKAGLLTKGQNTVLKEYVEEGRIGIRVYKNGFRILPYAEKGDDWLGLDVSYSNRRFIFPHSNDNFLGFVSIFDPEDGVFKETSSREGLIENEAYLDLKNFCYGVLTTVGTKVAEVRGRKVTSTQKDWNKIEAPVVKMQRIQTQLVNYFAERSTDIKEFSHDKEEVIRIYSDIEDKVNEKLIELSSAVTEQESREASTLEEIGMLRVLATLGITVAEFTHEMRQYIPALQADIKTVIALFEKYPSTRDQIVKLLNRLSKNIESVTSYTDLFDKTVKENVHRNLQSQSLLLVVGEFISGIKNQLQNNGIRIDVIYEQDRLFTVPMHYSEIVAILHNFYTNALKAIYAADVSGKILIVCGSFLKKVYIEFQDNGIGIPKLHEERLFDPFFTTTNAGEYEQKTNDDLSGSGLGLWIVKQIVEGYDGEVNLITAREGYRTCFRVELPARI